MSGWPRGRARDGGVDRIPLPDDVPGALWVCGKHVVGPDPEGALRRAGATTMVCLNEASELEDRYPDYVDWLRARRGSGAVWFPIPDLHAPPLDDLDHLLDDLSARLRAGERVLMHCGAGIGRTGTVATCLLMLLGLERDAALDVVATSRPLAGPEVGAQRELIDELAAHLGRSAS